MAILNDEKLQEVASHAEVKMFEIKMSQGAKPGKGGIFARKQGVGRNCTYP